ncbi:hypothetical protein Hanom_Chr10g00919451 [Helianthus anomalus]
MCFYCVPSFSFCILSIHNCTLTFWCCKFIPTKSKEGKGDKNVNGNPNYLPPPPSPSSRRSCIRSGASFTLLNNASIWPSISFHRRRERETKTLMETITISHRPLLRLAVAPTSALAPPLLSSTTPPPGHRSVSEYLIEKSVD